MRNFSMFRKHTYSALLAMCLCSTVLWGNSAIAQKASAEQKQEWEKLYPKLNSKMARMEEILNFADRFLDNEEFKDSVLTKLTEFIFLAEKSKEDIPFYLPEKQLPSYKKALDETVKLGTKLHQAVKAADHKKSKKHFNALDSLRRKSHSKWAE